MYMNREDQTKTNEQEKTADEITTPVSSPLPASDLPVSDLPSTDLPKFNFKKILFFGLFFLLAIFLVVLVVNKNKDEEAVKKFTTVYSFVPEKISKSASISIKLPEGVSKSEAMAGISFSPKVEGSWQEEENEKMISFKPKTPLQTKIYYAVNLDTEAVQMSGDFYVDEDPKVETIFPAASSEASENSNITIVFNRPMVPLTTLTEQESMALPITITPETKGKFKWISTRNLQFIPETTLVPASNYTIEIKDGLYSLDNLPVAPMTHSFITRPLRYENISSGQIGYDSPMMIVFNQPVDLDKTKDKIFVTGKDDKKVAVEVLYGETTFYDYETRKYVTFEDKSKLFVYQKKDSFNRTKLWDFKTTYKISITGASPLAGVVDLVEGKNSTITIPDVVKNIETTSERTRLSRLDFFDPEGKIKVTFFDEIDKDKSVFNIKGLQNITYGEKCQVDEKGNVVMKGRSCVIVSDPKVLIFAFDEKVFGLEESFNFELKKVINKSGFQINRDPINYSLKTYPAFKILRIVPESFSTFASYSDIYICSNSPLKDPTKEGGVGLSSYIKATDYIVFGRFESPRYISLNSDGSRMYDDKCGPGVFQTKINYGLLPETDYTLQLDLEDSFGQKDNKKISFKTGVPSSLYTRFFNMQLQYNVTTPEKTKFTYGVENLEYVDMHLCKMKPETFLKKTLDTYDRFEAPKDVDCEEVISKRIDLPKKYWVNNYFQINLADYFTDTRGHYILTFSNPLHKDWEGDQIYDRTYISVTNLAVGKKEVKYQEDFWSNSENPNHKNLLIKELSESNNIYWVVNNKTLTPALGATVAQYVFTYEQRDKIKFEQKGFKLTNSQGIAEMTIEKSLGGAVVRHGADSAVITNWSDNLNYTAPAQDASKTYVYTDRPIYRPGQKVYVRGIDRIGFDGSYEILNNADVPLKVYDAQGEKIYETTLKQSLYGTFSTEFNLADDAKLGTYRLEVYGYDFYFSVEEYVPAAFKLEAENDKEEYINGDTFKIDVQADYYFGVPLDNGTVSYTVTAQNYNFDRYQDKYFYFGQRWYYCYSCGYGDSFLFRGETEINKNGHATIERKLDFKDYFDEDNENSKIITVSITAKDLNGRSVSTQKSFIMHQNDFYLGLDIDKRVTRPNLPNTLRVKTVDTKGVPLAVNNLERVVNKVEWETYKRQEVDGGFYYHSEKKVTEVSREKIKTDQNGDYVGDLVIKSEGQYEVSVSGRDGRGNKIETVMNVYIYGDAYVYVPPNNNYNLDLEVQNLEVEVGDVAEILIKSPYEKAKALITIERGKIFSYEVVDVTGGFYNYQVPIKSEYAPNIYVSVLLLSDDPEIKFGQVEFRVDTKEKELSVEVTSDKDYYLPGEKVKLLVETKNYLGQGVPAEVSVAVADLSVLALKGNPKKNPLVFFYNGFPLSVTTASNVKNILHEVDIPLGTKGGGGGSPDDLAKKKRGEFKDTAFFEADVETDQNGKAEVTFTLPDNLTTWQIESVGVTKDTKLGVFYQEFTTKKDLMAVPLKPRFVIPGDEFSLGAKVFNQTEKDKEIIVTFSSDTLEFSKKPSQSIFVKAGESETAYFEVKASEDKTAGEHKFTFVAEDKSKTFRDEVEQIISITPNDTYETTATADFTKDKRVVEYLYIPEEVINEKGELTINANATMSVFLVDALSQMVAYPFGCRGCAGQLANSLSTIGVLKEVVSLPSIEGDFETIEYDGVVYKVDDVIKEGVKKIYSLQMHDGGFTPFLEFRAQSSYYLTIQVVSALVDLQKAGYEIDNSVLEKAAYYIESESQMRRVRNPKESNEDIILAEYILRVKLGKTSSGVTKIVESLIDDDAFLNENISSVSLNYLALLTADGFSREKSQRVLSSLENRIDLDGRGAYVEFGKNRGYFSETKIKNTALAVSVFSLRQTEHETLPNMLRWLLASRDEKGVWGSRQDTFLVVSALVDYLKWQKETESHFSLTGILDGAEIFKHEFNPKTVFDAFTKSLPLGSLTKNKLLPLIFEKEDKNGRNNNLYYDIALKYYLPVESLPPRDEGITITRDLYSLLDVEGKESLQTAKVGDILRGKITITAPKNLQDVTVEDFIPAGFEIVNFDLSTEDKSLPLVSYETDNSVEFKNIKSNFVASAFSSIKSLFGVSQVGQIYNSKSVSIIYPRQNKKLSPSYTEKHDDRIFIYNSRLDSGVYEYEYYLRALTPGTFQHLPARAEESYFPEIFGRTAGSSFTVTP